VTSVITLTTDFGTRDGYAAQMKGVMLSINPHVRLIDATHAVEPFSVQHGALVLKGLSRYFPPGTIHVAVVDPGVGSVRRGLALRCRGQIYIGPDNGLFSMVLSGCGQKEIRQITNPDYMLTDPHPTFHGRDVFAPVAANISAGKSLEAVGPQVQDPVELPVLSVERSDDGIQGEIIYVDRFGNLTSNIGAEMLTKQVKTVSVGDAKISGLKRFFQEVPKGAPVALVNSFGFLEIAVNQGNAADALGISTGSRVRIKWA